MGRTPARVPELAVCRIPVLCSDRMWDSALGFPAAVVSFTTERAKELLVETHLTSLDVPAGHDEELPIEPALPPGWINMLPEITQWLCPHLQREAPPAVLLPGTGVARPHHLKHSPETSWRM